ncbi:MAG: 2,3,4,5-tetrahydropyridine-2,6-dicarboxylate N-succinyltransferase [Pseudomonadota bacterium]
MTLSLHDIAATIETAWENRDTLGQGGNDIDAVKDAVDAALAALDRGEIRVAEPKESGWQVNQWAKKAVLLSFRLTPNKPISGAPGGGHWFDKVPSKFEQWTENDFNDAGFRAVPSCAVRYGSHVAKGAVLMPSYINIGAYVGEGTMVDTWSTIGSCAQIGANCHISGGVGIGGVLEPLQADPVIIEDNCFIGARSEVAEGVRVGEGAVISMGVFLGASTKIVDRATGEVTYGEVPPYAVVVPGTLPSEKGGPSLACAVIVKTVDERTRSKTAINDLLRD